MLQWELANWTSSKMGAQSTPLDPLLQTILTTFHSFDEVGDQYSINIMSMGGGDCPVVGSVSLETFCRVTVTKGTHLFAHTRSSNIYFSMPYMHQYYNHMQVQLFPSSGGIH